MHNINVRITINEKNQFTVCKSLEINKSVNILTSTAFVELPREFNNALNSLGQKIDLKGKNILNFIKNGDSIKIELGYNGDLQTEFEGYITKIGVDIPLVLECEDEMYKLKNLPKISKYIQNGNIKDILNAVISKDYNIELKDEYKIGNYVIEDANAYDILENLRENFGIRAFFKNSKTLSVGMMVDFRPQKVHRYNFDENIRHGSNLKFERKEDKLLEVTVKSKQPNGEEISYTTGKKGGSNTMVSIPNLSKTELKTWADKIYQSKCFTGFSGTLSGWCYPRTYAGDSLEITRPYYKDKHQDGRYLIESVNIQVNESNGIKRNNTISAEVQLSPIARVN